MEVVVWMIAALVFGMVTGTIAKDMGRRFWLWFVIGGTGGILGVMALAIIHYAPGRGRRKRESMECQGEGESE